MKDRIFNVLKIAISLGLMAYLFLRMDLSQVAHIIRTANYLYLVPAALFFVGAMTNAGLKWYVLLRAQGIRIPFLPVLSYTYVGFFFNNFLPANVGGDVMRGYGLARYTERAAEAAISIIVDRVVGLMAFMSAAVVGVFVAIFLMQQQNLQAVAITAMVGLVAIAGTLALLLSRRARALVGRLFEWHVLARMAPMYNRMSEALDAYRHNYGALILAFCLALLTLVLTNFTDFFIAQSLGGGMPLIFIFIFNPIIAFVLLVPISIGGLGVTQAIYPFFYGLVGIPQSLAFAVSLLKQLIIYVTSLPGGVLWWRGRSGTGETGKAVGQPGGAATPS